MLVSLREILKIADSKNCAIGSFNTPTFESLNAVIGAAQKLNTPVIIMFAPIHEEMGITKLDIIGDIMMHMAHKATVPVCVHLDHCESFAIMQKALDIGFTSVMYDGSNLPYEQNYANTCVASRIASQYGASVEGEIGSMGSREGTCEDAQSLYTDPKMAQKFACDTGIDALACSFGTVHGLYTKEPKLDFERLENIKNLINIPIVMHGGSGVSEKDYQKAIACGVRKINYYTYMTKAGGSAVEAMEDKTFFYNIAMTATKAMEENVEKAIKIFSKER